MKSELVSIITPCYNGSKYVAETINSVLSQSYNNWEMIIVDDGSKDNSAEIIKSFCEKDSRIRLIQQPNGGSANARNHGIREAEGQYIALLDSDDVWESNFLEEQIKFLKENKCYLVYSSYKRIDENSQEIQKPTICRPSVNYKQMTLTNHIGCLTGLYDCSKYGKVYLKEELKSIRDDYAFWLDIVKLTGIAYGNQNVLARYRVMQSSTTGKKQKLIKAQFNFYYKYLKFNFVHSLFNTVYWAIRGLIKFSK